MGFRDRRLRPHVSNPAAWQSKLVKSGSPGYFAETQIISGIAVKPTVFSESLADHLRANTLRECAGTSRIAGPFAPIQLLAIRPLSSTMTENGTACESPNGRGNRFQLRPWFWEVNTPAEWRNIAAIFSFKRGSLPSSGCGDRFSRRSEREATTTQYAPSGLTPSTGRSAPAAMLSGVGQMRVPSVDRRRARPRPSWPDSGGSR
jgi:hypothetical protein